MRTRPGICRAERSRVGIWLGLRVFSNLSGTRAAFDSLPNFTERASQGASQILGASGQDVSSPVATGRGTERAKSLVNIDDYHGLALLDTTGQNAGNGGSGGARTRNLCRDRAAL